MVGLTILHTLYTLSSDFHIHHIYIGFLSNKITTASIPPFCLLLLKISQGFVPSGAVNTDLKVKQIEDRIFKGNPAM